jgi:hypothetical protein
MQGLVRAVGAGITCFAHDNHAIGQEAEGE